MKNHCFGKIKELVGSIFLASLISLILSIGIKWILTLVLIPIMFLLVFLGVNIEFNSELISSRISILSFIIAFLYILFGDRLMKKKHVRQ